MAGDSAGGNLAAVVPLMARDKGGPALAYQLLIYPATVATAAGGNFPSRQENVDGYLLTAGAMEWFWAHYLAEDSDAGSPYASPLLAEDPRGLPPGNRHTRGGAK